MTEDYSDMVRWLRCMPVHHTLGKQAADAIEALQAELQRCKAETIEQCAKIADEYIGNTLGDHARLAIRITAFSIASEIRELNTQGDKP